MGNFIKNSKLIFNFLNLLLYAFYGIVIGISLIPSVLLIGFALRLWPFSQGIGSCLLFALAIGLAIYLFFLVGLLVFGLFERLLSIGFRPGRYHTSSPFFLRWLVYSGLHTISLSLILPYVLGSGFAQLYYKIIGCKLGKNVFINTVGLHDAYLLELGDNVVVGGKSDLTCHIFEGEHLILGKIRVGDNVMIGANCYIMPGVTIEGGCDIGANSVIRKNKAVPPGTVLMPVPAMPARQVAKIMALSRAKKEKQEA